MADRTGPRRALALALLALAPACASSAAEGTAPTTAAAPHGYVAGATEVAEAQVGLALAERGGRSLTIVDLATERARSVRLDVAARMLVEDGRFAYVADGRRLEVVDTGVWTVDHGDHAHHYRAPARSVGVLALDAPVATVVGAGSRTAVGTTDGAVTVLDREALEDGELRVLAELDAGGPAPFAVPVGDVLLLATPNEVVAVDDRGGRQPVAACGRPAGWAVLRSGVVIGCDEGVLLVDDGPGRRAAFLPYAPAAPRATAFDGRPRGNEAAALAGTAGTWVVDAAAESLRLVPPDGAPPVAATSPADGAHVLTVDGAGTVRLARLDGTTAASAALLPADRPVALQVDRSRAYVAAADDRRVLELDPGDGLRVARTLAVPVRPELLVEIGR